MSDYKNFKTSLLGGFDKDDVLIQVKNLKEEAYKEKTTLQKELKEKQAIIQELKVLEQEKEKEISLLKEEIEEKYKKYEENYNSIGKLVFDAQLKADIMRKEAQKQCEQMIANANLEAKKILECVESEVDAKLSEGKQDYKDIQREIYEIAQLMNQAQSKFMTSYKEVHKIISSMPEAFNHLEVEDYDEGEVECEEVFDEFDEFDENIDEMSSEIDELQKSQKKIEEQLRKILEKDV